MPVTRKVGLRTGEAVWSAHRNPPVPHENDVDGLTADVVIVGAGISGALAADVLTEAGLSVIVVDRRGPMKGSSAASTALLQSELDLPLIRLAQRVGMADAIRHYRRSKLSVQALLERTRHEQVEAEVVSRDSLYLAGDVLDARGLQQEAKARRHAGFEVEALTARELRATYGLARSAALRSFGNASAHPVKLTAGILNSAITRGARVFAPVEIRSVSESARGVQSTTSRGATLKSRYLIYASGYEMPLEVPTRHHQLASTWAIATRPQHRNLWPTQVMIWEASDPYLYLRTTADGRIICGGEDEDFKDEETRDALLARKTKTLEARLKKMMPWVDPRADYAWTGTFGATPTSTPSIGFLPRRRRTLAVLGYGGNGFTFSMIAAQVLRGLITGQGDPDADLYAFRAAGR